MGTSRKLSVSLGMLLLICSVIGILVVISKTNLKENTATTQHHRPSNQKDYFHIRPNSGSVQSHPVERKVNQSDGNLRRPLEKSTKPTNKVVNEMETLQQHSQKKHSEEILTTSNPIQPGTKRLEMVPEEKLQMHHNTENLELDEFFLSKSFGNQASKNYDHMYSQMNWKKFMPSSSSLPSIPHSPQQPAESGFSETWMRKSAGSRHSLTEKFHTESPNSSHDDSLNENEETGWMPVGGMSRESSEVSQYDTGASLSGGDAEALAEDHYLMDGSEDVDDSKAGLGLEELLGSKRIHVGEIFKLASSLYASGTNGTDLQEFLRVINETVNKGNQSDLLSHLNDFYTPPTKLTSGVTSNGIGGGRNAFETSLSAFVFMSFGVFLLNQIHKFMGKDAGKAQGRSMAGDLNDDPFSSGLDILFTSPDPFYYGNGSSNSSTSLHQEQRNSAEDAGEGRKIGNSANSPSSGDIPPVYVNDMFRGVLNLVNAYTKDSQVLECIWSLYCHDLDNTASKEGLYGLAARINSIGLRLIMDQIPAELTLHVLLRSLLGWDGLPCKRMFPKCSPKDATDALNALTGAPQPPPGNRAFKSSSTVSNTSAR